MVESKLTQHTAISIGLVLSLLGGVAYIVAECSQAAARIDLNATRIDINARAIDEIRERLELLDEIRASQRRIETVLSGSDAAWRH